MIVRDIVEFLEQIAPTAYQESYDNSGLIVGHADAVVNQALISLDCTEAVVDEAIRLGCGLIVSHHPIVFKGLKRFNGSTYVERVVMKAVRHDIALYAIHTNLDNVMGGVNARIAERLGLIDTAVLSPKGGLLHKLVVFVPQAHADRVRESLFAAGSGHIGHYSDCSFNTAGTGTFRAGPGSNPYAGERGQLHREDEVRIEMVFPADLQKKVLKALFDTHPYEEVAYDIYRLQNTWSQVGSGMVGELEQPLPEEAFLALLKEKMQVSVVRHTALKGKMVKRVALCGGAGGFLLADAIRSGADFFVSADYKYHEFFDAENKIVIADIGHFESEQFTQQLLLEIIQKKFPNFAIRLTGVNTNPIKYYI